MLKSLSKPSVCEGSNSVSRGTSLDKREPSLSDRGYFFSHDPQRQQEVSISVLLSLYPCWYSTYTKLLNTLVFSGCNLYCGHSHCSKNPSCSSLHPAIKQLSSLCLPFPTLVTPSTVQFQIVHILAFLFKTVHSVHFVLEEIKATCFLEGQLCCSYLS